MDEEGDRALLRDCSLGVPGAWDRFVERFSAPLAGVCRRSLLRMGRPAGSQEVADALQEVFLELFAGDMRALQGFRGRSRALTYLSAVAVRRVMDLNRKPLLPPPGSLAPAPVPQHGDPALAAEEREAVEHLLRGISALPPRMRLALSLQGKGASLHQVGRVLGISTDAASQLLVRSRAALRERIPE